ncbi:MAG: sulfurtransferase [Gammaproteobacteria bacterium]|nr:sulfurtransferase [Gammaproteobacteria bacterium]
MQRTITPIELQALLATGASITLLDVRRADDRAREPEMIPSARWLDPAAIKEWAVELETDREIVLYCVHGESVSNSVVDYLQGKGLRARFVVGGLDGWKIAGGTSESQLCFQ